MSAFVRIFQHNKTYIYSSHVLVHSTDSIMNKKHLSGAHSTSLTAAALQDHLSRQLSLSLSNPLSSKTIRNATSSYGCVSKRENRDCVNHRTRVRGSVAVSTPREGRGERERGERGRGEKALRCGSVGGEERVLDPHPPPLSLAQRMGLVERPQGWLSSAEWREVKMASQQRQDSSRPCPVCQEEFGIKEQVLLSCSHVFHRLCLRSVERFSGKKSCPLCRSTDYQTRLIYDGASCHRTKAATVIQAWWRGKRVLRWYKLYRERVPPHDPMLRSRYYQRKLTSLTSKMVETCAESSFNANSVLAAADSALATARNAMRILDFHSSHNATDWTSLRHKAMDNASTAECPICISPIVPDTHQPPPSNLGFNPPPLSNLGFKPPPPSNPGFNPPPPSNLGFNPPPPRLICLLSCGHMLHLACVTSLEQFCTVDNQLPLCPLCRASYHRQLLY